MKYDNRSATVNDKTVALSIDKTPTSSILARNLRRGDKVIVQDKTMEGPVGFNARVTRVHRHPSEPNIIRVIASVDKCEYLPGFRLRKTYDLDDALEIWESVA